MRSENGGKAANRLDAIVTSATDAIVTARARDALRSALASLEVDPDLTDVS